MPKISQIDEVPCQAEVRILQKITLKGWEDENDLILIFLLYGFGVDVFSLLVASFLLSVVHLLYSFNSYLVILFKLLWQVLLMHSNACIDFWKGLSNEGSLQK